MASSKGADIVDAAIRVFGRKGYSGATVQDVADELGIPKATIYHYVDSKVELLEKVFMGSADNMNTILSEVRAADVSKTERIAMFIRRYIFWSIDNLDRASIYSKEWRYTDGDLRDTVLARRAELTDFLVSLIEDARDAGELSPVVTPRRAAVYIWGTVSAVPDWYRRDGRDSPDVVADDYAALTLQALSLQGAPPVG